MTRPISRSIAAMVLLAGVCSAPTVMARDEGPVLSLSAVAVAPDDPAGPGRTRTGSVSIVIERWSTEAERQRLTSVAPGSANDALLASLRDMKPRVGYIRDGNREVADIQFAVEDVDRDTQSRRVLIATDRPVASWSPLPEATTPSYEFTLFEITLSKYGAGEGRLAPPSRLSPAADGAVVETNGAAGEAIRLTAVSVDLKK